MSDKKDPLVDKPEKMCYNSSDKQVMRLIHNLWRIFRFAITLLEREYPQLRK